MKCTVVSNNCKVPANGPGRTRAKCFACGQPVCTADGCSRKVVWYDEAIRRVCAHCETKDAKR